MMQRCRGEMVELWLIGKKSQLGKINSQPNVEKNKIFEIKTKKNNKNKAHKHVDNDAET